jgi:colicin import membrane protein
MRFDRGIVLSVAGHGAFLVWALVSFARPLETKPFEAISADVISADDFNKMTAGSSLAPKKETPKPVVEKIAEARPAEDLAAKVTEKKEVKASTEETNPEPAPKEPDPKPAAAPDKPKEEAKAADKKEPDQKIDPIADALKKDEAKKPEKKAESKPQPVKKPEPQQPKFDPRAALAKIDKREATRLAAAGSSLNQTPVFGAPKGRDDGVSMNEINALAQRLKNNWTAPAAATQGMKVRILLSMKRDGTLAAPPKVVANDGGNISQQMRDSTISAIYASQPFDMLRPATYDVEGGWKELDLRFNFEDFM